jgi:trehalose-6-phosphatase
MITIAAEQYEAFIKENTKPLFGSYFDGTTYTFYESPDEAAALQPIVKIMPEEQIQQEQVNNIDINSLTDQQIITLANRLKNLL